MLHGPVWTSHWWQAHPLLGVAAVLVMLGALLLFLKGFSARIGPYPELLRKLVHMGIGLVTLSFPWLFADPWPVFLLAGAACVLMTAVKAPGRLRTLMGGVVDGVERRTHGDVYFPIGVAGLFWLAQRADAMEEQLLFVIPMLLLTLGDAVAALVGVRYGRHRFTTGEGGKSVEGSLACFVAAFLSTLLPLLQVWRTDHAQAVIIAVIVGMLATALEAVAWSGLDNLFLPLGGYLILHTHLHMGSQALAAHLFVTIALFVFVIMWRRRTTLNDSAALGAALYAYCAWSIGGLEWLYAPVLLFVGYPLLWPRTEGDSGRVHSISVVLNVGGAGLVWLVLSVAIPFLQRGLRRADGDDRTGAPAPPVPADIRRYSAPVQRRAELAASGGARTGACRHGHGCADIRAARAHRGRACRYCRRRHSVRPHPPRPADLPLRPGPLAPSGRARRAGLAHRHGAAVVGLMNVELTLDPDAPVPHSDRLPLLAAGLYARHGADAHLRVLRDGMVAARCSLWWSSVPTLTAETIGAVGHYAAMDAEAARMLLDHACEALGQRGCSLAVGPMDGNTWRSYRLVTDPGAEPPFFLEPNNPPDWPGHFLSAGFAELARYNSAVCTNLAGTDPRLARVAPRMAQASITIRPLDLSCFDAELAAIHKLSIVSFRGNLLYTPISEAEFIAQYRSVQPVLQPELVLLAEQNAQLVGFLFAVPDLLQAQRGVSVDTLVIKTAAVLPGRVYAGLGGLLVARCHAVAAGRFRRAIHALMHESNESRAVSSHYARPFRTYALYARRLQS